MGERKTSVMRVISNEGQLLSVFTEPSPHQPHVQSHIQAVHTAEKTTELFFRVGGFPRMCACIFQQVLLLIKGRGAWPGADV